MQSTIAKKHMQSTIAEKHTLEPGTHQPCTQSLEKGNLDNSKSNNNQSNNPQRLKLYGLRNSTWTQATAQNIVLQKSLKKAQNFFLKLDLKFFSGFKHRWSSKQALKLSDPFKANFKARFFYKSLQAIICMLQLAKYEKKLRMIFSSQNLGTYSDG